MFQVDSSYLVSELTLVNNLKRKTGDNKTQLSSKNKKEKRKKRKKKKRKH